MFKRSWRLQAGEEELVAMDLLGGEGWAGRFRVRLVEFIEGAGRLRGSAKALDIWRMETKIEAIMGSQTLIRSL